MMTRRPLCPVLGLLLVLAAASAPDARAAAPTSLDHEVDARESRRHLLHATIGMDVDGTPLALAYPKWIPGDHGPEGPIANLVGLAFEVDGRAVAWERDSIDAWTLRLVPPPGRLTARLTFTDVAPGTVATTARLAILSWNTVVLAPRGISAEGVRVRPALRLPEGWTAASALAAAAPEGEGRVRFAEVSLERLVDSPVLLGAHGRLVDLAPGGSPAHRIALYGDTPGSIEAGEEQVAAWRRLVAEGLALFGGRAPFRAYTFLAAFSDEIDHFGLEHAESSDNRLPERTLSDDGPRLANASLLAHEYVHAWNGKYRRPAGLLSPDFARPIDGEDLWVYEGLTEYWGWVLAARAGLYTRPEALDELALMAALQERRAGRSWRSLRDTGRSAHALYHAESAWTSLRRSTDFYGEGALLWLEVDATIRARSRGRRSLDDLARAFFAPAVGADAAAGGPLPPSPYRRDELVRALGAIEPFDWAGFFAERVDRPGAPPPLGGLARSGYALVYRDSLPPLHAAYEGFLEKADFRYSLGFRVDAGGTLDDIIPDSPAGRAGLAPGEGLVAVNDRAYSTEVLRDALAASGRDSTARLELLVRNGTFFRRVPLEGVAGARLPALVRRPGEADGLAAILARRAAQPPTGRNRRR